MNDDIELVRYKLEKLIIVTERLTDCKIVSLSQELDKLIINYYLQNSQK